MENKYPFLLNNNVIVQGKHKEEQIPLNLIQQFTAQLNIHNELKYIKGMLNEALQEDEISKGYHQVIINIINDLNNKIKPFDA